MKVIKRSGVKVDYDPSRINDYLDFVCNGLENVSASAIVMASQIHFHDGIKTSDINLALRQGAESLISVDAPDYSIAAGRILMTDIRKNVYGEFEPPQLYDIIVQNTSLGLYDPYVLERYTKEEIDGLNDALHHDRDFSFCYAGALEWANKYLVQDRGTKSHYETPQVAYMLMSMFYYIDEKDPVRRLGRVIRFYNYLSLGYINTPTPHNGGLRTPVRSFSSCAVAKCGDSINSINETSRVARVLATRRAGLGIDTSSLRGNKSPIRGGTVINTSPVYHAQAIEKAALSCSQGGARKGSLTFNWWGLHIDIDDFVSLKNTARSESSAMHHSDHVIWLNGRILKEAQSNGEIYLFDPPQVPKLMELFYSDKTDEFNEEYDRCIKDDTLRKKCVRAQEYITHLLSERASTHRIYIGFADNANKQSMYDVSVFPIYNTNLCLEIFLPNNDLALDYDSDTDTFKETGLIALCNLMGVNFGMLESPEELEEIIDLCIEASDNLLDYQDQLFPASKRHNDLFRPLGFGITGLAYWLAKRGLNYSNCYEELDKWMQHFSYYLIKKSVSLAKERGKCLGSDNTKWAQGIVPMDIRKKSIDSVVKHVEYFDWSDLREDLKKYGIRNASLSALFPAETSAKISGSGTTNGVEPIRDLIVVKGNKDTSVRFCAPELSRLKDNYDIVWKMKDTRVLTKTYAVMQKYVDQGISVNEYYNPLHYEGKKVPLSALILNMLTAYSLGIKSMYYYNQYFNSDAIINADLQESEQIDDNVTCESCAL